MPRVDIIMVSKCNASLSFTLIDIGTDMWKNTNRTHFLWNHASAQQFKYLGVDLEHNFDSMVDNIYSKANRKLDLLKIVHPF